MSAADKIRGYAEEIQRATPPGDANICAGHILAALAELQAELAWEKEDHAEAEAELERLTVGRATLEDQTNRAELAEARADVFEAALRQIAAAGYVKTGAGGFDDPASTTSDPRLEGLADIARAALVLSGGSE